jgi:ATP-dependent exoDNAse (exonuclease V) beta subunit
MYNSVEEILDKVKVFNDSNFTFDEESHTYRYKGKKFISVTTIIKNFIQPFNTDFWSRKKAIDRIDENQDDRSEENIKKVQLEIQKEWDDKRDRSNILGTDVHKYIEEKFDPNLEISGYSDEEVLSRIDKFEKNIVPKLKGFVPVAQEVRVFSPTMKLAGTIDALFLKDGKLYILDWKTNGNLKTDNDKMFSKLLAPFGQFWDNELNKYSIQLSLYRLILAEYGIDVSHTAIVYVPPSEKEPKIYKPKDFIPQLEMYFGVDFYSSLAKK